MLLGWVIISHQESRLPNRRAAPKYQIMGKLGRSGEGRKILVTHYEVGNHTNDLSTV